MSQARLELNERMILHRSASSDTCHLCGRRPRDIVTVRYPEDAAGALERGTSEDPNANERLIRICAPCARRIQDTAEALTIDGNGRAAEELTPRVLAVVQAQGFKGVVAALRAVGRACEAQRLADGTPSSRRTYRYASKIMSEALDDFKDHVRVSVAQRTG